MFNCWLCLSAYFTHNTDSVPIIRTNYSGRSYKYACFHVKCFVCQISITTGIFQHILIKVRILILTKFRPLEITVVYKEGYTEKINIIVDIRIYLDILIFAPCINSLNNTFIVPTDAHCHEITEMLKQYINYNTCSDMFPFTQGLSSGSSPVLS
jgi:hypothetical protein